MIRDHPGANKTHEMFFAHLSSAAKSLTIVNGVFTNATLQITI